MPLALATNPRTATKAAIKRGSAEARRLMNRLDREQLAALDKLYRRAARELAALINSYADTEGSVRLNALQQLLGQAEQRLSQLGRARDLLLEEGLEQAAQLGVRPYAGNVQDVFLTRANEAAVRFVREFVGADGLQLSDRIWRLDNHGRRLVRETIEQAVIQGHSASQAASDLLARGEAIPPDIRDKLLQGNAERIGRQAHLALVGEGSPRANALRLMRTELNRAHGEAYINAGEQHEEVAGWKFLISPRHPEPDICDMHAQVNRYGLGPGVYPDRKRCPWPAHPNTLSYTEIVFIDEVTEADREGKQDRIAWLKQQPPGLQESVLNGRKKRMALQRGILTENEIATPWKVLKKRYEGRGIDIRLPDEPPPPPLVPGTTPSTAGPPVLDPEGGPRRSNKFMQSWEEAETFTHPLTQNAVNRFHAPAEIRPTGGGAYHQAGKIHMGRKSPSLAQDRATMRHETGHYIDYQVRRWKGHTGQPTGWYMHSSSEVGTAAMKADDLHLKKLQQGYYKGAKKRHPDLSKARYSNYNYHRARNADRQAFINKYGNGDPHVAAVAARKQLENGSDIFSRVPPKTWNRDDWAINHAVAQKYGDLPFLGEGQLAHIDYGHMADLTGAITRNRIGWGHSASYYKQRAGYGQQTEAFANTFDLLDYPEGSFERAYMEQLTPNFSRFVLDILEELFDA